MEKEIWKHIDGLPDYYVSNLGRVKSVKKGIEHIMKPFVRNNSGYLSVHLCFNGNTKFYYIHRLVAKAFIPNPSGLPEVNHKDENKSHNFVENLEWCDRTYNINYGTMKQRRSDALLNRGDLSRPVRQLNLDGEVIATYPSIAEAVRVSGMTSGNIWYSANGITKNPRTYRWEYIL